GNRLFAANRQRERELARRHFALEPFPSDYDVMLECKAKELALLKLRDELPSLHPSGTVKFI
ncbi:MAG: hypothetical protein M3Y76_04545, partial [Chloroflexota bacterium]|nr:hypothetical protein [Chloroflexota bacterium]